MHCQCYILLFSKQGNIVRGDLGGTVIEGHGSVLYMCIYRYVRNATDTLRIYRYCSKKRIYSV